MKGIDKMEKTNALCCENPSVRPSFDDVLEKVKEQISIDCVPLATLLQAEELAAIIAEVLRLRPEDKLRVDGVMHSAADVQAVYAKLENEHIMHVIETYNEIPYPIRSPKMYLRTALYNAVFELNNAGANLYAATGGGEI